MKEKNRVIGTEDPKGAAKYDELIAMPNLSEKDREILKKWRRTLLTKWGSGTQASLDEPELHYFGRTGGPQWIGRGLSDAVMICGAMSPPRFPN